MPAFPSNLLPGTPQYIQAQQIQQKKLKDAHQAHLQNHLHMIRSSIRTMIQLINLRHAQLGDNKKVRTFMCKFVSSVFCVVVRKYPIPFKWWFVSWN